MGVFGIEGWWAARDYMDRIHLMPWNGSVHSSEPVAGLLSPWTGIGPKYGLLDRLMRGAFFEVIRKHPLRVLWVYVGKKPPDIVRVAISAFASAPTRAWLWSIIGAGVGLCALLMAFAGHCDLRALGTTLVASVAAVLLATLPNLWAYPGTYIMGDAILLMVTLLAVALGFSAFVLLSYARARLQAHAIVTEHPSRQ